MAIIKSSPTRLPASIVCFAARPNSVPAWTDSRRMSPVEIFGSLRVRDRRSACVPLPAPGGPSITTLMAPGQSPWCATTTVPAVP